MSVFLWVVVVALGVALFAFSVYAFAEGGLGMLEGARFERCPRCGRHGLVARGRLRWRLPAPLVRLASAPPAGGRFGRSASRSSLELPEWAPVDE